MDEQLASDIAPPMEFAQAQPSRPLNVQFPMDPYLRAEDINSGLAWMQRQRKQAKEDEAAAIRWQGQQDYAREYDAAKSGGADDLEASKRALLKSARKLYWNEPERMVGVIKALRPDPALPEPEVVDYGGEKFIKRKNRFGETQITHIPNPSASTQKVESTQEYKDLSRDIAMAERLVTNLQSQGNVGGTTIKAYEKPLADAMEQVRALRAQRMAMTRMAGRQPEIPNYEPEPTPPAIGTPAVQQTPTVVAPPTQSTPANTNAIRILRITERP